jgi:hypothetical protein
MAENLKTESAESSLAQFNEIEEWPDFVTLTLDTAKQHPENHRLRDQIAEIAEEGFANGGRKFVLDIFAQAAREAEALLRKTTARAEAITEQLNEAVAQSDKKISPAPQPQADKPSPTPKPAPAADGESHNVRMLRILRERAAGFERPQSQPSATVHQLRQSAAELLAERERVKLHPSDLAPDEPPAPTIEEKNKALEKLADLYDTDPLAFAEGRRACADRLCTTVVAIDRAVKLIRDQRADKDEQSQTTTFRQLASAIVCSFGIHPMATVTRAFVLASIGKTTSSTGETSNAGSAPSMAAAIQS